MARPCFHIAAISLLGQHCLVDKHFYFDQLNAMVEVNPQTRLLVSSRLSFIWGQAVTHQEWLSSMGTAEGASF